MCCGSAPEAGANRQAVAEPVVKFARDESFVDALILNLCPTIKLCSFTVWIIIINLIVFIVSLSLYGIVNTEFLAPNSQALSLLGWKDAKKIKDHY